MLPAVVLAGGRGRRLGGIDKALLPVAGRPLMAHVLDRLRPQAGPLAVNANGDPGRFAAFGLPVLPDELPDFPGPLAGVLAAMEWAAAQGGAQVLTVPCDTPFLPDDLAGRLAAAGGGTAIACAASAGRTHPVVAVWPVALRPLLAEALRAGMRRVEGWSRSHPLVVVAFAAGAVDPFLNINTAEDAARAALSISARAAG
jgi:molybdopterin-guanine dinucleotide biosynthesis protein A